MTARATGLQRGAITIVRSMTGVIAADSATLTDANIDPTKAVNCSRYDSLFIGVEIDAGTAPTMTVEALFRDPLAADGSRWKRLLLGARAGVTPAALAAEDTGALDGTKLVELRVFGALVFFRVTAVQNATSTTGSRILALPGAVRTPVAVQASLSA